MKMNIMDNAARRESHPAMPEYLDCQQSLKNHLRVEEELMACQARSLGWEVAAIVGWLVVAILVWLT